MNLQEELLVDLPFEITLIDTGFQRPCFAASYLIRSGDSAAFIEVGASYNVSRLLSVLDLKGISRDSVQYVIVTHIHLDHAGGAQELKRITKAPVWIHPFDLPGINFRPDGQLYDGQEIAFGTFRLSVIHTPGHSPGGVSFHAPGAVFTGDTLFAGSVGRSDFPGGSHEQLMKGVREKIFPLGDELRVYPGHGPHSTIGRERTHNPFFRF